MTVSTTQTIVSYIANGTTLEFTYPFRILDATDLNAFFNGVEQSPGSYTVTGVGNANGGTVIFVVAPAADTMVTLLRIMEETQLVDYVPFDSFPAETHERALDKLTMLIQQTGFSGGRAIRVPPTEAIGSANLTLPDIPNRANKAVLFDSGGNVVVAPFPVPVTDHGGLTGLADDDHPHYYNASRANTDYVRLDGQYAMTGYLSLIPATPPSDYVAAPKIYVDSLTGIDAGRLHTSCRVSTTADVVLATVGLPVMDGVQLVDGDRVLVQFQTNHTQNGLYNAHATAWTRTTDADAEGELNNGHLVFVTDGTTYGGFAWGMVMDDAADGPWTPDVDGATWTKISGALIAALDARYLQLIGGTLTGQLNLPVATGSVTTAARVDWVQNEIGASIAAHVAAADPHPGYLTLAEGDAAYYPLAGGVTSTGYIRGTNSIGAVNGAEICEILPNVGGIHMRNAGGAVFFNVDSGGRVVVGPIASGAQGSNAIGARFISTSDPITVAQPVVEGDIWLQTG